MALWARFRRPRRAAKMALSGPDCGAARRGHVVFGFRQSSSKEYKLIFDKNPQLWVRVFIVICSQCVHSMYAQKYMCIYTYMHIYLYTYLPIYLKTLMCNMHNGLEASCKIRDGCEGGECWLLAVVAVI